MKFIDAVKEAAASANGAGFVELKRGDSKRALAILDAKTPDNYVWANNVKGITFEDLIADDWFIKVFKED